MKEILQDLEDMMKEENEPDFEHRPRKMAYLFMKKVLENTPHLNLIPTFAPDGDGGVAAEWNQGKNIVKLVVHADTEDSYIYIRKDNQSKVYEEVNGLNLSNTLNFVFDESRNLNPYA